MYILNIIMVGLLILFPVILCGTQSNKHITKECHGGGGHGGGHGGGGHGGGGHGGGRGGWGYYPYMNYSNWNYPDWNNSEVIYINEANGNKCRRNFPVKYVEELKTCFPEISDWSKFSDQIKNIKILNK
jgi:hypothetical protein